MSVIFKAACLLVGDRGSGKNQVLQSYVKNIYNDSEEIDEFEKFERMENVKGKSIQCKYYTSDMEDYERIKEKRYEGIDVILACYSIVDISTFRNLQEKWIPEIQAITKEIPIIVVGTHVDQIMTTHRGRGFVSIDAPRQLTERYKLSSCIEVSAKTERNLVSLFKEVGSLALDRRRKELTAKSSKGCVIC
ncbi:Rac2h, Rho family GTPase [Monocercomonoides exilis]|uniref:Rac2h, Rho family GTPase n=1 Tax=Monocercomonoides exilis TaxID=2049356 RepID=UPI0035599FAA|nr:Rac2h, Rho family GTPase [Monocercomonoides exilis]|eukprot:MONOS_639.1-p1 / transcript=MONOS_639.1 / gene=MONOS_639 / organism=Monocercomonoides_exilis_PA203 / gene_product=Rac2h, Rho family GTPase / transcript_product=Rac2h, Rho family GTPase / location=Mono_scaffold00010:224637-225502(+) / protein_length=191 / sequence_SO=supercontig / SO=protein_coding / is_pseudo=false